MVNLIIDGILHVCLITVKDIAKGTQLTYNYGYKYWEKRNKTKELL